MKRSTAFSSNIIHSIGQTKPEVCGRSHISENSVTGTSVTWKRGKPERKILVYVLIIVLPSHGKIKAPTTIGAFLSIAVCAGAVGSGKKS